MAQRQQYYRDESPLCKVTQTSRPRGFSPLEARSKEEKKQEASYSRHIHIHLFTYATKSRRQLFYHFLQGFRPWWTDSILAKTSGQSKTNVVEIKKVETDIQYLRACNERLMDGSSMSLLATRTLLIALLLQGGLRYNINLLKVRPRFSRVEGRSPSSFRADREWEVA